MKRIIYSQQAIRSLGQMQPKRRAAIFAKVEAFARGERVDIRKLVGTPYHRIRVGQDRVVINEQGLVVSVIAAGPRGGVYKE